MPVAHVVERLAPGELLVPGEQVDRRVPGRAPAVVEVTPVDVDPRSVEPVDDLAEAAEVDRDEVVDLQPGQQAHGLQRPLRAARRVGGVDLVEERRPPRAADLDAHVAGEREERDRVRGGIRADEHERVRPPGRPFALAGVVPDDERDGRLSGQRDVELTSGLAHLGRLRGDRRDGLVEVEIRAARGSGRDHEARDPEPHRDLPDEAETRPRRPLGLAVEAHGRGDAGRQNRLPVSVRRGSAPQASFQSGSHEGVQSVTRAPRQALDGGG